MKTSNRLLAFTSLLGVSALGLTGCVLPFGGGDEPPAPPTETGTTETEPTETDTTETEPTETETDAPVDVDLDDTAWTGTIDGEDVELTFNADGTIDFDSWGELGELDSDKDTWEVTDGELTISLAYEDNEDKSLIQAEMSGPVAEDSLSLSGTLQGYPMTAELDRA